MRSLLAAARIGGLATAGHAATLRASTTLERPQVRIADLFDDAGPQASRVLGPGPAPGARIVVEAAQLSAIARQFGVDWRAASAADRIVIDRPGQMVPRDEVMAVLRAALSSAGAAADAEIELPGFTAPIVSFEAQPRCAIEQIDYEQGSGRFTATLAISTADNGVQRQRLSGRLQEMAELYVPTRRLLAGQIVAAGDLVISRVRAGGVRGELVRDPAQAVGQSLRRVVSPGQPLLLADLGKPVLVHKNGRVVMQLQNAGIQLTATGTAMESGALGERIAVMNPTSRAIIEAEITGPDQVRVHPDSQPRPSPASTQVTLR